MEPVWYDDPSGWINVFFYCLNPPPSPQFPLGKVIIALMAFIPMLSAPVTDVVLNLCGTHRVRSQGKNMSLSLKREL